MKVSKNLIKGSKCNIAGNDIIINDNAVLIKILNEILRELKKLNKGKK